MDVRGWPVDTGAEAQAVSAASGAAFAFRRTGANGRKLRGVAGRAWTERVPSAYGGRCDQHQPGDVCGGGDDVGSGRHAAGMGEGVRDSTGVICGLEDGLPSPADGPAAAGGNRSDITVWADV